MSILGIAITIIGIIMIINGYVEKRIHSNKASLFLVLGIVLTILGIIFMAFPVFFTAQMN